MMDIIESAGAWIKIIIIIEIFVSNFILLAVILNSGLRKKRSYILLLNSVLADVTFGVCLSLENIHLARSDTLDITQTDTSHVVLGFLMFYVLHPVTSITLVLVNVSYVLETRKEYAHLNGSRLLAAVMVASPWLYALLVVIFFFTAAERGVHPSTIWFVLPLVGQSLPGLCGAIAAALFLFAFVPRNDASDKEGTNDPQSKEEPDLLPTPTSAGKGDNPEASNQAVTSLPMAANHVRAATRFLRDESIHACVLLVLVLVFVPSFPCACFSGRDGGTSVFCFLPRPVILPWLWLLRQDYRQAFIECLCCCRGSSRHSRV